MSSSVFIFALRRAIEITSTIGEKLLKTGRPRLPRREGKPPKP
jgi:hypothetical protein